MDYTPQASPMNLLISPFVPNQQENELYRLQHGSDHLVSQALGLPSPQFDMMNNNYEFISHSPGSSSSNESNIVSPPQQHYHPSDFLYNPSVKRSTSVPPHSKPKLHQQDSMYSQFQLNHHMASKKPLPIKIPRVNAQTIKYPGNSEAQRRQLDEKLEKVNFDDITVAELKEILRERGLSATGRKAELLARLKGEYELLKRGSPLLCRVANLNISPTKRHQRLYVPYSPPIHYPRLASSVPDSNTQSFFNDQYMKPSSLRQTVNKGTEEMDIWDDQTLQNFLNGI